MEEHDNKPVFLLTGPMGGDKDVIRYAQPHINLNTPWTSDISKATVLRFLAEAKYFLQIYNVVVQHFAFLLPFPKFFGEDSDRGEKKKMRDSLHAILWGVNTLDEVLNPDHARHFLQEDEDHEQIDLEVERAFQSLRQRMASSSVKDSENIKEAESLQELMEPESSCTPQLITKMKERFMVLLDAEVAELKKKLQQTLPEFAEKNVNKINKLVMRTINYSDHITSVEIKLNKMRWPAYCGKRLRYLDLRENYKEVYHVIYAPAWVVQHLESICLNAYSLLKKMKELEKVMQNKDPDEYAKLLESKEKISFPVVHIDKLMDMS